MKILVTGSEGNIGKKLVSHLIKSGYDIYCCDIIQKHFNNYIIGNICNPSDLIKIFYSFRPEVTINLAAMVSRVTCERSPTIAVDVNISGTNNILELCKVFNCKLIHFSTSEIYGNISGVHSENREDCSPNNMYGISKYLGEKIIQYQAKECFLNALIVRPFMIYDEDESIGNHRSAIIRFAESLCKKEKIEVHLNSKRGWLHISDAIFIIEKLLKTDNGFEIINIGSDEIVEIKSIAKTMCYKLSLNYNDYVIEKELPNKMTLNKIPDLTKQWRVLGIKTLKVDINSGIDLVIEKMKKRIIP